MSGNLVALAAGNRRRVAAADLRREIRELPRDIAAARVAEIVCGADEVAGSIWAEDLLVCVAGIGPRRADRLLVAADVRGRKRVREITPLRSRRLAALVVAFSALADESRRTA